ncbi:MAG: ABC transporter permease [Actinomycetota bacterium]|nr:ABC transporter permease [Actinomycetota bacterium]
MPDQTAADETGPQESGTARPWGAVFQTFRGRPEAGALFATLFIAVLFSFWADNFLSVDSFASTMNIAAELGIVAMAVTLLMISGEFDLSVGSVLGISSLLVPYLYEEWNLFAGSAVLIAFLAAAGAGVINGTIVIRTRIPSFIVTLGMLLFWRGALFVVTQGFPISVPEQERVFDLFSARVAGLSVSTLWFLAILLVFSFVLQKTKAGNWIFAAGGNESAAREMGVPVDRVRLGLFVTTALAAALAGVIQVGRFSSVDANRGEGLELEAIAAAVIGGSRLSGGYGSVVGTALGCLMIGMIRNGLALAGVASYWYEGIIGLLIIVAVVVNRFAGGREARE